MPLVLINMGGEMIYILDQRLHAQSVQDDKSKKVVDDVVRTMFNPKFVAELFKPQELYSAKSMREVFDKLAHSSIMRLSTASMDKLYDLMMMGFKYQMLCIRNPEEMLFVTLNHLRSIRTLVHSEAVIAILDNAIQQVKDAYGCFSFGDFCELRHALATFFQDKHVKVSLFLQSKVQANDGRFRVGFDGPTPPSSDSTPPGTIRYFTAHGDEETHRSQVSVTCAAVSQPPLNQNMDDHQCTLGENMYLKDRQRGAAPPDREAAPAGQNSTVAAKSPEKAPVTTAKSAMAELNMLASLLGDIAESVGKDSKDDGFRLNIFNDASIPEGGVGTEVKSEKVQFDSKGSNAHVSGIANEFGAIPAAEGEEDDLLALMDGA